MLENEELNLIWKWRLVRFDLISKYFTSCTSYYCIFIFLYGKFNTIRSKRFSESLERRGVRQVPTYLGTVLLYGYLKEYVSECEDWRFQLSGMFLVQLCQHLIRWNHNLIKLTWFLEWRCNCKFYGISRKYPRDFIKWQIGEVVD